MFKTELEQRLESGLYDLDIPFKNRIYVDDMLYAAQCDDITNPVPEGKKEYLIRLLEGKLDSTFFQDYMNFYKTTALFIRPSAVQKTTALLYGVHLISFGTKLEEDDVTLRGAQTLRSMADYFLRKCTFDYEFAEVYMSTNGPILDEKSMKIFGTENLLFGFEVSGRKATRGKISIDKDLLDTLIEERSSPFLHQWAERLHRMKEKKDLNSHDVYTCVIDFLKSLPPF